ncbi:MAG: hypothetical protein KDF60_13475, partial [Calditrichaeota bacterium]|nr:hypothetical protein [Calditrichota bacterium]
MQTKFLSDNEYVRNYKLAVIIILAAIFTSFLIGCNEEPPVASEPDVEESYLQPDEALVEIDKVNQEMTNNLAKGNRHHKFVVLPAGSEDALSDAVKKAGTGGTVLVKAGLHKESGTVTISQQVTILGEHGAVFEIDTQPETVTGKVDPAIHILNTRKVVLWGIEINPVAVSGGTAILIQDAPQCILAKNTLNGHQYGVILENGDRSILWKNSVTNTTAWQTGAIPFVMGLVNVNGEKVSVIENDLSSGFLGAFMCDKGGLFYGNNLHENFIGLLVCKVPENNFTLPDGSMTGAHVSGTHWLVKGNSAIDNLDTGYLVIDGANNNLLIKNHAANNGTYDIELAGESERFGFYTPTSFENKVFIRNPNLVVKDCGVDNMVRGGSLVD